MSDTTGQGAHQAAKVTVGSAAERARSAAPAAYDAAANSTKQIADTVSEHPMVVLLAAAGIAYLVGQLRRDPSDQGSDWQSRAESMQQQLRALAARLPETAASAKQRGRNTAEYATQAATDAGGYARQAATDAGDYVWQGASRAGDYLLQNAGSARGYVAQGVREYPASALLGVAAIGVGLGYLLRGRS